jgi:hypothetical protein
MEEGNVLHYMIFSHDVCVKELVSLSDIPRLLGNRTKEVMVCNARYVHNFVYQHKKVRKVNGTHDNPKYHLGWTVQLNELRGLI